MAQARAAVSMRCLALAFIAAVCVTAGVAVAVTMSNVGKDDPSVPADVATQDPFVPTNMATQDPSGGVENIFDRTTFTPSQYATFRPTAQPTAAPTECGPRPAIPSKDALVQAVQACMYCVIAVCSWNLAATRLTNAFVVLVLLLQTCKILTPTRPSTVLQLAAGTWV